MNSHILLRTSTTRRQPTNGAVNFSIGEHPSDLRRQSESESPAKEPKDAWTDMHIQQSQIVVTDRSQEIQDQTGSPARFRPPQPAKRARDKLHLTSIASRYTPATCPFAPPTVSQTN